MAGTLAVFNGFKKALGEKVIDLGSDTFYMALSSVLPSTTATDPRWGSGGGTDLSLNEVSGTNYTAGGNTCGVGTWSESAGTVTFDVADPAQWVQSGTGPNNIRAAILYDFTDTGKRAIAWADLTVDAGVTPISLQTGDITLSVAGTGIYTLT